MVNFYNGSVGQVPLNLTSYSKGSFYLVHNLTSSFTILRKERGPGGGGVGLGYFGLWSYADVPTFRVDFLTQNVLGRVQIWVSTKCWAKKYFRPGRKLGFGHELF